MFLCFAIFFQMSYVYATVHNATIQPLPNRQIGMYLLLADDTVPNYTSTNYWKPSLYQYQKSGANVLYFTFINPTNLSIPPAFASLSQTLRKDTNRPTILFAIGGYSYSNKPNPWPFLSSKSAAEAMAQVVATWPSLYGCDGIDLDIEVGAGSSLEASTNIVYFVQKINQLNPKMIITQPVFGYPQVKAETFMINSAFNYNISTRPIINAIGIMVYSETNSLQYLKNYVNGSSQWDGFPIHVNVPQTKVICGIGGAATRKELNIFVNEIKNNNIRGVMVWYASVIDSKTNKSAIQYSGGGPDASNKKTIKMWEVALREINN
jgi:hypothetical protein